MSKQQERIVITATLPIVLVLAAAALFSASTGTAFAQQQQLQQQPQCDQTLWQHVYHPDRLQKLQDCISVTGRVETAKAEADGDYHIRVKLDPQYSSMINSANVQYQQGDLVVEPVCEHTVTQTDAEAACTNFSSNIKVPAIGSHVMVVGSHVLDKDHNNWAEIHPATSITAATTTPEFGGTTSIIIMVIALSTTILGWRINLKTRML